ncbi:hypothetical protein CNR34_00114 [Pseudomonas phage nickie]|uniref:Uncharacterized protein n=1 Tax=Pseudomonas phage nickie TaxID=2048977 RepID=A0A2H4P7A6_9CAUD|nr:hypothetical protein FDJ16_gp051 [Pseudomonas phage nickie]ATW58047.1 hypothetical protein CNR34_00114 [Pseudomonas phage nickie]
MIWPFTELKKLRDALAMANETNKQAVENFTSLHQTSVKQGKLIDKLSQELERKRMRLVACGVGAMANTRESAAQQRVKPDSPYYCASVGDVYSAVDREMKHREDLESALDRIADMVKGDDGQAWKEAEKFLSLHRSTKICVKCGSDMIPMHSEDKKLCSNGACGHEVLWTLAEGQHYQYKRNVEPFVEDRSNQQAELEPPRATLERL